MHTNFTENDYKIMKAILDKNDKQKGRCKSKGTTVQEIEIKTNLSSKKIRDTLKKFVGCGFATEGIRIVRTKTYLLTPEGVAELNSLRKDII